MHELAPDNDWKLSEIEREMITGMSLQMLQDGLWSYTRKQHIITCCHRLPDRAGPASDGPCSGWTAVIPAGAGSQCSPLLPQDAAGAPLEYRCANQRDAGAGPEWFFAGAALAIRETDHDQTTDRVWCADFITTSIMSDYNCGILSWYYRFRYSTSNWVNNSYWNKR